MLSQFSGSFRDSAHESCIKGAIRVRGGVLKSTLVVGNDTTVHDVHTYIVAFSLSSLMRTLRMNGSRKRFAAYDTLSCYFIMGA